MILVCAACRRIRPMHKETCIYVGAIRYHDAVGNMAPPPPPWVTIDEDNEDVTSSLVLAEEDRALYARLKELTPKQHELGVGRRVVDV